MPMNGYFFVSMLDAEIKDRVREGTLPPNTEVAHVLLFSLIKRLPAAPMNRRRSAAHSTLAEFAQPSVRHRDGRHCIAEASGPPLERQLEYEL